MTIINDITISTEIAQHVNSQMREPISAIEIVLFVADKAPSGYTTNQ